MKPERSRPPALPLFPVPSLGTASLHSTKEASKEERGCVRTNDIKTNSKCQNGTKLLFVICLFFNVLITNCHSLCTAAPPLKKNLKGGAGAHVHRLEFSLLMLRLSTIITAFVCALITEEVSTLFRGTSLTTTLMDQYMKMVAIPYLQKTIGDVVAKILECKQSCEV